MSADLCEGGSSPPSTGHRGGRSSPPSTGHRDGTSGSVGPCLPRGTAALAGPLAHSAGRSLPWNLAAASRGAGQSSWPGRGPAVQSSLLAAGSAANNEARQQPLCKAPLPQMRGSAASVSPNGRPWEPAKCKGGRPAALGGGDPAPWISGKRHLGTCDWGLDPGL